MVDVVLNVGANTIPEWGGFRAPIDDHAKFSFIPIPLKDKFEVKPAELAPNYDELGLKWAVPSEKLTHRALVSPNFKNLTYGHLHRPSDGRIFEKLKKEGRHLVFFSTLRYGANKNQWGAYLIGYFSTEFVLTGKEMSEQEQIYGKRFEEYSWYRTIDSTRHRRVGADWWISGSNGGLFTRAIALSEPDDPKHWNKFAIRTLRTTGQPPKNLESNKTTIAKYNWTLVVDENETNYFWNEVNRTSLGVERRLV